MIHTEEELYKMYKSSFINEDTFIIGLYLCNPNSNNYHVEKYQLDNYNEIINQYRDLINNPFIYEFKELFKDISFLKQMNIFDLNKIIKNSNEVEVISEDLILKSSLKKEKEKTLETIESEKVVGFVRLFIHKLKSNNLTEGDIDMLKKLPKTYSNGFLIAKTLLLFKEHSFLLSYTDDTSTLEDIIVLLKKYELC